MMALLTLDQAAVWVLSHKYPDLRISNSPPVPIHLVERESASEQAHEFRFWKMVLTNAADAGVLPCIKKQRKVAEVRRMAEAIRRGNPDSALPEGFEKIASIYDYWFALADLQDFIAKPDRLSSDSSESSWPHGRAALAKALWLLIRVYVGTAKDPNLGDKGSPVVNRLLEALLQEVLDLETDGKLPEKHGMRDTTLEGCINEALEEGRAISQS